MAKTFFSETDVDVSKRQEKVNSDLEIEPIAAKISLVRTPTLFKFNTGVAFSVALISARSEVCHIVCFVNVNIFSILRLFQT